MEPNSSSYPFLPLQDSLLLDLLSKVAKSLGKEEQWKPPEGLLKREHFYTPNSTKQSLLASYPPKIRSMISKQEWHSLTELLIGIAEGKEASPALDVSLELAEWILTGFDAKESLLEFLQKITGKDFISSDWLEQVVQYMEESIRSDLPQ